MPRTRVGISGWTYEGWRGVFYPRGLPQKRELQYATHVLNSLEINGSFYSLQRPSTYETWYDTAPDDFVYAVKGSRYITQMRKLQDVRTPLANFFASGVLLLREKLGPFLWQFPPVFGFERERFEEFFKMLPRDTHEAARLARKHDQRLSGRSHLRAEVDMALRHAVEIRNPSFLTKEFIELLRKHKIAFVFADSAGRWPYTQDVTADFIYIRLHGAEEMYVSGYTDSMLDWWADRIRKWRRGGSPRDARLIVKKKPTRRSRDTYVYFDNDAKVQAPFDAMRLAERVGATPDTVAEAQELVKS